LEFGGAVEVVVVFAVGVLAVQLSQPVTVIAAQLEKPKHLNQKQQPQPS